MDIAQEIAIYLEFQTRKMKGVKELVTVDTFTYSIKRVCEIRKFHVAGWGGGATTVKKCTK